MGWKSDTYQEQIKEFAKAMFNGNIVVYYKKDLPTVQGNKKENIQEYNCKQS